MDDQESARVRRCCGLDVHKETIVVCVLSPQGDSPTLKTFGTFRNDLIRMRVWLKQLKVTDVAMESTGVYWRSVWNVLEQHGFELMLTNPAQVKALQGRKSDKRDCRRIAEFLHDRRLDGSFVPPPEIRELRALTRLRCSWLEQRNEVHNQIRDLLETVNIKLSSVASDLMGVTGRQILKSIVDGNESPERLSWQARGKLRKKEAEIRESLKGQFSDFFRGLLQMHLKHYDFLTAQVEQLEGQLRKHMEPYCEQVRVLCTIPGVQEVVAWSILAEMGADMTVFPTAAHAASWAGLCPGQNESAGVIKSSRTKKGDRYLRRVLTQSAWAVSRCKEGYLRAFFYRVMGKKGWGKAIIAVAHKVLIIAYELLKNRREYRDLGSDYFDRRDPGRTIERLKARLQRLGVAVVVGEPAQDPAAPVKRKRGRPRKSPAVEMPNPGLSTT